MIFKCLQILKSFCRCPTPHHLLLCSSQAVSLTFLSLSLSLSESLIKDARETESLDTHTIILLYFIITHTKKSWRWFYSPPHHTQITLLNTHTHINIKKSHNKQLLPNNQLTKRPPQYLIPLTKKLYTIRTHTQN